MFAKDKGFGSFSLTLNIKPLLPSAAVRGTFSSAGEKTVGEVLSRRLRGLTVANPESAVPRQPRSGREPKGRVSWGRLLASQKLRFLCLLYFGEAKESEPPSGRKRQRIKEAI